MFGRKLLGGTLLAALVLSSLAVPAAAADLKIGFIDSERIFAEFHGTQEAQNEFTSQVDQWNRELEGKVAERTAELAESYRRIERSEVARGELLRPHRLRMRRRPRHG